MNKRNNKKKPSTYYVVIFLSTVMILMAAITTYNQVVTPAEVTPLLFFNQALSEAETVYYWDFDQMVKDDKVDTIYYSQTNQDMVFTLKANETDSTEEVDPYDISRARVTRYAANEDFRLSFLNRGVDVERVVEQSSGATFGTTLFLIISFLPVAFMAYMLYWWVTKGINGSKITANEIIQKSSTTLDDIIGLDETKEELQIIIELIKNVDKSNDVGAKIPHGILLSGPPGVGKTMIAKAIANASGVPFLSANGSDFQEMYVGAGAKHVRELFSIARKHAPCIIFIDEFDAIGTKRNSAASSSEDRRTINALLKEMDGFKPLEKVFVLAATNYPEQLDSAITRSGRFDREISIQPPKDWKSRYELFKHYFEDKKLAEDVNLESYARTLAGYTGADIAAVCNEAALVAIGKNMSYIDDLCIETAIDKKVFKGTYSKDKGNEEDLKIVAYHEAGHAIVSLLLGLGVTRASIKPTTSGVGGAIFNGDSDSQFMRKSDLEARIKSAYAGRASEEVFFGDVTTGASNDITQATMYLDKYANVVGFDGESGLLNLSAIGIKPENTKRRLEQLSEEFYSETVKLVTENKGLIEKLANALLSKETLSGEEVKTLLEL